ncbi:hypothetical protein Trydic_g9039 [Trypoxylus dichotomus]
MKSVDELFNETYERVFYGGSYYDGVRIKEPDEFDLCLLLRFPECKVSWGIPGHVMVKVNPDTHNSTSLKIRELFAYKGKFLLTSKFNSWFKSVVHKALRDYKSPNQKEYSIAINQNKLKITVHDHGPAENLVIRVHNITINIDLVPCILFPGEDWPEFIIKNPVRSKVDSFSVAAKSPKRQYDIKKPTRYWRLSFQEQERYILEDKGCLKPCLKFLKLLRDSLHHDQIASYYLKTFMMNLNKEKDDIFWKRSLSEVFMDVLEEYVEVLEERTLKYHWDGKYNILSHITQQQLESIAGSTRRIFNKLMDTNDPDVILDCFRNR